MLDKFFKWLIYIPIYKNKTMIKQIVKAARVSNVTDLWRIWYKLLLKNKYSYSYSWLIIEQFIVRIYKIRNDNYLISIYQ